jgi:hypothetical protein
MNILKIKKLIIENFNFNLVVLCVSFLFLVIIMIVRNDK